MPFGRHTQIELLSVHWTPLLTASQERLTAKEAQGHAYFNPVRDPEVFKQNLANANGSKA